MVGQHSIMTVYSLLAKAGLWAWIWSVRAAIGDPGDGSFGWVRTEWGPQGAWVEVPVVNLGYLPWLFELEVHSEGGVPYLGPDGQPVVEVWVAPRSVRRVRLVAAGQLNRGEDVRFALCTSPRLGWLRTPDCHVFTGTAP